MQNIRRGFQENPKPTIRLHKVVERQTREPAGQDTGTNPAKVDGAPIFGWEKGGLNQKPCG